MKRIIIGSLLSISLLPLWGQNLIYNGNLSQHNNTSCVIPFEGMLNLSRWYSVGNSTVDYYISDCSYLPPTGIDFNPFFHYNLGGQGFIGFWGLFKTNFTMSAEAFAIPLLKPLQSDMGYWFSVDIRSRGKGHPVEGIYPLYCPTSPKMEFNVYTNLGEIRSTTDQHGGATDIRANKVLTIDILPRVDTLVSEMWTTFTGCFQANDGDDHIGFSMTIDSFAPVAPCNAPYDPNDFNKWLGYLYFNADNFQLLSFPLIVTDTVLLCTEQGKVRLNAANYFESFPLTDFQPVWDNGQTHTELTFMESGWHHRKLYHQCGSTDFRIYVTEKRCETKPFVPTAFTPNFDGNNDELHPFFSADFPILNFNFMVFDRWGNNLYKSTVNDGFTGWDGRFRSKDMPQGVYVWTLTFDLQLPDGKKPYQFAGNVLLVR